MDTSELDGLDCKSRAHLSPAGGDRRFRFNASTTPLRWPILKWRLTGSYDAMVDASTAAQLRVIVAAIAGGSQEVTPPPESVALALTVARRGMDLRVLLKIYGAGRLAMLGFVDESIEALPIRSGTQARTSGPSVGFGDEMAGSDHRIVWWQRMRRSVRAWRAALLRVGPRRCTRLSQAKHFTPMRCRRFSTTRCGATTLRLFSGRTTPIRPPTYWPDWTRMRVPLWTSRTPSAC